MTAPGTGNPYMDWVSGSRDMRAPFSSSPFGGVVFDETWRGSRMGTGPRTRIAGDAIDYNLPSGIDGPRGARPFNRTGFPIEAPYEGMRVLPGPQFSRADDIYDWGSAQPPGRWMGRGQGTDWRGGYPRGSALDESGPWEWGPDDMNFFPNDWGYSALPQSYRQTAWPWAFSGNMPPVRSSSPMPRMVPEVPF